MRRPSKWCVAGLWVESYAKPELILVPLYENKKSLSVSELDFLGVTWPAFNEPSVAREALFCQPPGYETPFGWAVHLKMGARVWIFDIRTNGNMLKILMCNITDIQPDDLSEVSSAMLHYINHFVNYQTDNADYYSKYVCLKA